MGPGAWESQVGMESSELVDSFVRVCVCALCASRASGREVKLAAVYVPNR